MSNEIDPTPPQFADALPEQRSMWPSVIGIIGIVYASLMLMCSCGGLFTRQIYAWVAKMDAQASGEADHALEVAVRVAAQHQIIIVVLSVLAMIACLWLLIASIALVRRRAWSRIAILFWSALELILLCGSLGMQYLMGQSTAEIMGVEGTSSDVDEAWLEAIIGMVFVTLFSVILPVFFLTWFMRGKIKSETAAWA